MNRGPAFAARASVINRASSPSIVVTCGRTKLPPSKTIYIHRRRGWRIVSAPLSERGRPCRPISRWPTGWFFPAEDLIFLPPELQYLPFSRETHGYAGSAFGIRVWTPRVGAIGSSAALIITTRETRSLSWDSVLLSYPPTEDPHRRTPFGASPFFFSGGREHHEIESEGFHVDLLGYSQIDIIVLSVNAYRLY